MNRKIYSADDLPEPVNGVIYLEEGDEIRGVIDLGTNVIGYRCRDVAKKETEVNQDIAFIIVGMIVWVRHLIIQL